MTASVVILVVTIATVHHNIEEVKEWRLLEMVIFLKSLVLS